MNMFYTSYDGVFCICFSVYYITDGRCCYQYKTYCIIGRCTACSDMGIVAMRVLTQTPSRKRVETMVEATHDLTNGKGSGLFLFVDRETLAASNPLDVEWMSGKGERVRLAV